MRRGEPWWQTQPQYLRLVAGSAPVPSAQDHGMTHDPTPGAVRAFFVYGTLMQGESNHPVVARHGLVSVQPGSIRGVLYDTGQGYPAMRRSQGDQRVQGEVIVPRDLEAATQSMDALEGYAGPGDPGNLYEREQVEVTLDADGSTCTAWVYVYARELPEQARIASGSWRQWRGAGRASR